MLHFPSTIQNKIIGLIFPQRFKTKQGLHGNAVPAELVGKYMLNNET
jgi:hypothetical protein